MGLSISVIIPVLNEAATLATTVQRVQMAEAVEVIVVDGGSGDETLAIAKSLNIKAIALPQGGRARQMNTGAKQATGDILLFLHADTRVPLNYPTAIRETLARAGAIAGAFELAIDGREWGLRWVERAVRVRSRLLGMPYGDQALFLPRRTFWDLGGFPDLPIMEDFELVRRLRRRGQIAIAPFPVLTSARRWQKLGILKTTAVNQIIILGYLLGISPTTLARWYRRQR